MKAQTTLSVGDLQILGATADANDSFSFVLWKDISEGTVIRFMDHSFTSDTGTAVNGSENDMSLSFSTALTAGTVIRVEHSGDTFVNGGIFSGTKTGSLSGIAADGDQVFAYQGAAVGSDTDFSGRTLLYGLHVANTSWITTGIADPQNSYLPPAIAGTNANFDSGNFDNVDYTGTRIGLTSRAYQAAVSSISNYTQNNTRFDLQTGGFTINLSAELHWDANGSTAGDGGSGTWDTTTQDRFRNGVSGTTYLRWVNSATDSDHTAVFGGTAGTVSIASGGVTASGLRFDTAGYTVEGSALTLVGPTPGIVVTTGSAVVSSEIVGTNGLGKSGAGTLLLSGENTYTGSTVINGGTLIVNGNQTAANGTVTVATGGKLGGIGTIGGATTVQNGGSLTGATEGTVGEIHFVSNLTTDSGSTWLIDLVQNVNGSSDRIDVGGILNLNSSTLSLMTTGAYTIGHTYTIASYTSRVGTFNNLAEGAFLSGYQISYGNSAITLTAVPEPGTLGLIGLTFGGLIYRRLRKRPNVGEK